MAEARVLAGRLLVVDWDYFFPNPALEAVYRPEVLDYDWFHRENRYMIFDVWDLRAMTFMRRWAAADEATRGELTFPRCQRYESFWQRFDLSETFGVLVSESNSAAGLILPETYGIDADGWEEVWLFDAHHDCGYPSSEHLTEVDEFDCGSWMIEHHKRGSDLHVRYPWWRASEDGATFYDAEEGPLVPVERRLDRWPASTSDDVPVGPWDAVLVCRSGAWVPSWNDDQFEEFITLPKLGTTWIEETIESGPRPQPDVASLWTQIAELDKMRQESRDALELRHLLDTSSSESSDFFD
ncbi:hypothetical protein [Nocardia sp. NPDC050435]|uniref:hypothetical protein n=1 Tax=Nocardia sp. NPDC050435 TaxID=3155040 RepID=UPI0033C37902